MSEDLSHVRAVNPAAETISPNIAREPRDWSFSELADFDSHVREQLPWYELATSMVSVLVRQYLPRGGLMYDVGASTGNIGLACRSTLQQRGARLVPVEPCERMVQQYIRDEMPGYESIICGTATDVRWTHHHVAVYFLSLSFMTMSQRRSVLFEQIRNLAPGGATIVFDKMQRPAGQVGAAMHRITLSGKLAGGARAEDILAKELALSGIQRPLEEGFWATGGQGLSVATEVFRFGEFAGYVLEV